MSASPLSAALDAIRADLDELEKLLPAAWAIQWSKAPVRASRPDTEEEPQQRAEGGPPSDPTSDVVLDDRRLALRGEVQQAERLIRRVIPATAAARQRLGDAIEAWEGFGQ